MQNMQMITAGPRNLRKLLTERQSIFGPLNSAGEISYNAVDDGSSPLSHEGVLRSCPEKLLITHAIRLVYG